MVAITADSCAENKRRASTLGVRFVACASHRFNLAVPDVVHEHHEVVDRFKSVMCKFYLTTRAKLHQFTERRPLGCNETKWSSVNTILSRYIQIRNFVKQLDMSQIDNLVLDRREEQPVVWLLETMDQLNSFTLKLQDEKKTLSQAHVPFDTGI